MKEETQHFLKKLQKLEDIWKHVQHNIKFNLDIQTRLTDIQEKGRKIFNAVTQEGNLNAGGKFEWVDSVLIKVGICCTSFLALNFHEFVFAGNN